MKNQQPQLNNGDFASLIKEIRDQLTTKISFLSTVDSIDIETTKLLKEITSIVKELDKMVKDNATNPENGQNKEQSEADAFYKMLRDNSIINTIQS